MGQKWVKNGFKIGHSTRHKSNARQLLKTGAAKLCTSAGAGTAHNAFGANKRQCSAGLTVG
eukprot:5369118-Amphidinium_carterae.1